MQDSTRERRPTGRRWLQRLGKIGFLFFLIKGLLWLLLPMLLMFWSQLGL